MDTTGLSAGRLIFSHIYSPEKGNYLNKDQKKINLSFIKKHPLRLNVSIGLIV